MLVSKVIPLVAIFIAGAWAQFDEAACPSGFDWNKNSLGQDPCTIGSMLDASCRGLAQYTYPPLNATQYYLPPRANHSGDTTCDCNTVMYSLYMACASCQGGTTYSWVQWLTQCTTVYVSQYPVDIAQGTAVPYWAYYNVTSLPSQNWTEANSMSVGRDPEQKPKAVNTVASSGSGHNTLTKTSSGSPGPTGSTNTKSGTNVGAIVGGVVGSVVPLTLLAIAAFLYTRHRKQKAAQQQPQLMGMPPQDDDPYKQRPISYGAPAVPNPPLVPYDPSDPSTFPPQSPPTSVTYTTQPNNTRGAYSGMPEV